MDKLWLKQYQTGVPQEIALDSYKNLNHFFEVSCKKYATHVAYSNFGTTLTYEKLYYYAHQFAAYLKSIGLKPEDKVAIMLPNILQYPVALFGTLLAGGVVVNTNPLYTADEVVHQLNDSGATIILVLEHFAHTVEAAYPHLKTIQHIIVTTLGDLFPTPKRWIVNAVVRYIKNMIPPYSLPKAIRFWQTIHGEFKSFIAEDPAPDQTAFIQYTGGTTGVSKGAVLSHQNLIANILQACAWISPLNMNTNDVIVTALPLYHIFSLTANCLTFLHFGSKNILITNPRDLKTFIKQIKKEKITAITGVNTLFNALLNHPEFETIDFTHLRLSLSGGMALQKKVAERWLEKTKTPILEAYGLTETSPAVTINPMNLKTYNGSIGLPLPSTEVSIRNDQGQEINALIEAGELCVKGPQVMSAYWQKPQETSLVFWPDGFLKTGDIAKINEQGFIYLVDRKKDMILVSGFNVYPNEVEQVIGMMPKVLEVGVVGIPSERGDEIVKACIVKKDQTLTENEVIEHCRQHLTAYKVPKHIVFFDELPKTNVGKILRRALKEEEKAHS